MNEEHEPKISLVEILLIVPYLLVLDIGELVLAFFGIDDFWLGDILGAPVTFYLWLKGMRFERYLATQALELIPYVGALPLLTVGFLLVVALDRNPQLDAVVQKAAAVAGKGTPGRLSEQETGARRAPRAQGARDMSPGGQETSISSTGKGSVGETGAPSDASEKKPTRSLEQVVAEGGAPFKEPLPLSGAEQKQIFESTPKPESAGPRQSNKNVIINDKGDVDLRKAA